jgi:hypothetical protein
MIAIVRRAPVASFAVLAYASAWSPWVFSIATGFRNPDKGPVVWAAGVASRPVL